MWAKKSYFSHCCLSMGKFMISENKCSRDLWVNEFLRRFQFPRLHNTHVLQLPLTHSSSALTFIQITIRTLIPSYIVDHTFKSHTRLAILYWRFNYVHKKMISSYVPYNLPPIKHLSASPMFNLQYKRINMQVIHHTSVHDNSYVIKLLM